MDVTGAWVLGIAMGLLSLVGLLMASNATDSGFYWTGLAFFLFGVLFIFALIKRGTGGGDKS